MSRQFHVLRIHDGVQCSRCNTGIVGARHRCAVCQLNVCADCLAAASRAACGVAAVHRFEVVEVVTPDDMSVMRDWNLNTFAAFEDLVRAMLVPLRACAEFLASVQNPTSSSTSSSNWSALKDLVNRELRTLEEAVQRFSTESLRHPLFLHGGDAERACKACLLECVNDLANTLRMEKSLVQDLEIEDLLEGSSLDVATDISALVHLATARSAFHQVVNILRLRLVGLAENVKKVPDTCGDGNSDRVAWYDCMALIDKATKEIRERDSATLAGVFQRAHDLASGIASARATASRVPKLTFWWHLGTYLVMRPREQVFLSHRGPDCKAELASMLERSPLEKYCFLDILNPPRSETCDAFVVRNLCGSTRCAFLVTDGFGASKYCLAEAALWKFICEHTHGRHTIVLTTNEPLLKDLQQRGYFAAEIAYEAFPSVTDMVRRVSILDVSGMAPEDANFPFEGRTAVDTTSGTVCRSLWGDQVPQFEILFGIVKKVAAAATEEVDSALPAFVSSLYNRFTLVLASLPAAALAERATTTRALACPGSLLAALQLGEALLAACTRCFFALMSLTNYAPSVAVPNEHDGHTNSDVVMMGVARLLRWGFLCCALENARRALHHIATHDPLVDDVDDEISQHLVLSVDNLSDASRSLERTLRCLRYVGAETWPVNDFVRMFYGLAGQFRLRSRAIVPARQLDTNLVDVIIRREIIYIPRQHEGAAPSASTTTIVDKALLLLSVMDVESRRVTLTQSRLAEAVRLRLGRLELKALPLFTFAAEDEIFMHYCRSKRLREKYMGIRESLKPVEVSDHVIDLVAIELCRKRGFVIDQQLERNLFSLPDEEIVASVRRDFGASAAEVRTGAPRTTADQMTGCAAPTTLHFTVDNDEDARRAIARLSRSSDAHDMRVRKYLEDWLSYGEAYAQKYVRLHYRSADGTACHARVRCDVCGVFPIVGIRWHCTACPNYDECDKCRRASLAGIVAAPASPSAAAASDDEEDKTPSSCAHQFEAVEVESVDEVVNHMKTLYRPVTDSLRMCFAGCVMVAVALVHEVSLRGSHLREAARGLAALRNTLEELEPPPCPVVFKHGDILVDTLVVCLNALTLAAAGAETVLEYITIDCSATAVQNITSEESFRSASLLAVTRHTLGCLCNVLRSSFHCIRKTPTLDVLSNELAVTLQVKMQECAEEYAQRKKNIDAAIASEAFQAARLQLRSTNLDAANLVWWYAGLYHAMSMGAGEELVVEKGSVFVSCTAEVQGRLLSRTAEALKTRLRFRQPDDSDADTFAKLHRCEKCIVVATAAYAASHEAQREAALWMILSHMTPARQNPQATVLIADTRAHADGVRSRGLVNSKSTQVLVAGEEGAAESLDDLWIATLVATGSEEDQQPVVQQ